MYNYNTEIQEIADFTVEEIDRKAEEMALLFEEIILTAEEIERKTEEMDLSFEKIINALLEQKINALFEEK